MKVKDGGERWCFWHEDCEIKALWVGPHMEQINAGASSSTKPDDDMPGWMRPSMTKNDQQEKPEKRAQGKKRPAEKEDPLEEPHKEAKRCGTLIISNVDIYIYVYPGIF